MKLLKLNPTVRETNRYLDRLVSILKSKHGGVSNEDFEHELVTTTGIGWKQVKNYKNHPKPQDRLKDNALVLKYIVQERNKDKGRKAIRGLTAATFLILASTLIYWYASKPNQMEQFVVHQIPRPVLNPSSADLGEVNEVKVTRTLLRIPSKGWVFRLGPIKHSKIPLEKFTCSVNEGLGSKTCSSIDMASKDPLQAFVLLDGEVITRYSILAYKLEDIKDLKAQLKGLLGDDMKGFPAGDKNIDQVTIARGDENIMISGSNPLKGMRPYLSVLVNFK